MLLGIAMGLSELWLDPSQPHRSFRPLPMPWQRRVAGVGLILIGWRMWVIGRRIIAQGHDPDDESV